MTYVMHENPVFNTFSTQRAAEVARKAEKRPGGRTMTGTVEVAIKPLSQVVEETGFAERVEGRVDFLSIDVEGFELDVIRGFDFGVLRPKLIVTEHLRGKADAIEDAEIVKVMAGHGYWVGGYTGHDLYSSTSAPERRRSPPVTWRPARPRGCGRCATPAAAPCAARRRRSRCGAGRTCPCRPPSGGGPSRPVPRRTR